VSGRQLGRRALVVGAAAALLPDVDVLIRSAADPLLAIEHHRGFTHSLVFVPIGGAFTALVTGGRASRRWAILAGILAYLSHSLLDAATTYGTQLFWPFSSLRVGADIISIIDPLFTLIVLAGVVVAWRARRRLAGATLLLALGWLLLGLLQRERAGAVQNAVASARGERIERGAVFPTFGNTIVWRSIYLVNGQLRMDRIRVPWFGQDAHVAVTTLPLVRTAQLPSDPRTRRDFARFAWFSDGWVARAPSDPSVLGDARYSLRADRYDPVWGVRFHGDRDPPTEWVNRTRDRDVGAGGLWREITGRGLFDPP
jgi:inner membrane protein